MCASAAPSAIACSWPRASLSIRCTSVPRAWREVKAPRGGKAACRRGRMRGHGARRDAGAGSPAAPAPSRLAIRAVWPSGVSAMAPRPSSFTSPSMTESSHTEICGQLRHASMTSARVRGRSATQARNWSMIRLTGLDMSEGYHESGPRGRPDWIAKKKCPGLTGSRGREPDGGRGIGGLSGTQTTRRRRQWFRASQRKFFGSVGAVFYLRRRSDAVAQQARGKIFVQCGIGPVGKRPGRSLPEQLVRGGDQTDGGIGGAIFAELVGVDDRRVVVLFVIGVEPRQDVADLILAAVHEFFAFDRREVELGGAGRRSNDQRGGSEGSVSKPHGRIFLFREGWGGSLYRRARRCDG